MPPEASPGRWSEGCPLCWMVCLPQDSHSQPCSCPLHALEGCPLGVVSCTLPGSLLCGWRWLMGDTKNRLESKRKIKAEYLSAPPLACCGVMAVFHLSLPSAVSQHVTVWPAELPSNLTSRIFTETTGREELVWAKSKAFCVLGGKKNLRTLSYYSFLFHPQINE